MQIKGRIKTVNETQVISDSFRKRDFVLVIDEDTDYPQFIKLEFTQDKTDLLAQYKIGDVVTVDFNLRGREWTNPKGETVVFNTLQAWKIYQAEVASGGEVIESQSAQSQDFTAQTDDDLPF